MTVAFAFCRTLCRLDHATRVEHCARERDCMVPQMPTLPTTPKGARTRENLLVAARGVFGRRGYIDATITEIAQQAGLSIGGLYRYFESKQALFVAVISELDEELFHAIAGATSPGVHDPRRVMLAANERFIRRYVEDADLMAAFVESTSIDEQCRAIWWQGRRRIVGHLAAILRRQHGINDVDGVAIDIAVEAMVCMMQQAAYVWFAERDQAPRKVSAPRAAEIWTDTWYRTFFGAA